MSVVLDASALLAYLQRETGADTVRTALGEALISTVNWTEVVQKAAAATDEIEALREDIQSSRRWPRFTMRLVDGCAMRKLAQA